MLGHFCGSSLSHYDGCIALKAIRAASEAEPDVSHLSGMAATTLAGNSSPFSYFSHFYCSEILLLTGPMIIIQDCSLHSITSSLGMASMPMTLNSHYKDLWRKMKVSGDMIILPQLLMLKFSIPFSYVGFWSWQSDHFLWFSFLHSSSNVFTWSKIL